MSPPIDLLVIAHSNFKAINRGVFVEMRTRGVQLKLVIPRRLDALQGQEADVERPEDPPIFWVSLKNTHPRLWDIPELHQILETERPRAIFLEADPASILALRLSRWVHHRRANLVCYSNDNTLYTLRECVRNRDWKGVARLIRSKVWTSLSKPGIGKVLVLSQRAHQSMKVLGFGSRTSLMPLGYDPAVFYPNAASRVAIRQKLRIQCPAIIYAGRMIDGKGVEYLLEALDGLGNMEWRFLLDDFQAPQDGAYPARINRLIESSPLLNERTIRFHANHVEISDYLNASDLLVAPSCLPEQYGRILVEAMACGKAVVASRTGAYPEIIRECGVLVPPRDVKAIARVITILLQDKKARDDLGQQASIRAIGHLSIKTQADIILKASCES